MDEASATTTTDGKSLEEAPIAAGLEPTQPISFLQLFRFSTCGEIAWLFFGFIMCCIKALTLPAVVIIYSEFTSMLVDRAMEFGTSSKVHALPLFGGGKSLTNATLEARNEALYDDSISYGLLLTIASVVMFIAGIFSVDIFNVVALRQVSRMRIMLFTSVMRQDIGWHDLASKQNFVQSMVDDVEKIRDGISEKVGHFVYLIVGFIITVAISFSYGWKLTLAVSSYIPIVILVNYYVAKFQGKLTAREQEMYAGAGNLAEEILSAIRTVVSFGGEKAEVQRYENFLVPARKASQWKGAFSGLSDALLKSMLYLSCAGAFWYGVNLIIDDRGVEDKEYTPAILMIAFFGIIVGADNIARTAPFLESFATARGCATNLFKVIDLQSKIDPLSTDGKLLNYGLRGDVEFQDVFFRYPSRPEVIVHRGLNIRIRAGQTVALVGSSGCGKSTCVQLLQRFYDPVFGSVMLDDLDIRKYNIQWLRSNIAVVGQEPVLFLGSIAQNISYGKPGATQKEIEAAATQAGAHEFITGLPESYRTMIGERGSQLSGGQKQRIAIARALIQNPKILLLDEATSALDYQSEKQVQQALDLASKGRTTIVVSHRLSAIRGADKIVFIQDGKVLEEGSHDDLMALESAYYRMVRAGDIHMPDELEKGDEETTIDDAKRKSLALLEKSFETSPLNFEKGTHKENSVQFDEPIVKPLPKDSNAIKLQDDATAAAEKPNFFHTFARIVRLSRPEWCYLILGTISAIAVGCLYPAFAIIFGEFYAALAEQDPEDALRRTAVLSWACLGLAFVTGLVCFLQTYLFNYAGIWLTTRMRAMTFKAMVSQEVGWFDDEDNSVGALSARLSGEAAGVQGAIGYPLSGMIQALSNFISSVTVAMYYNWKLALLCLANCPIIIGSVILEAKMMSTAIVREKQVIEEACRIATESITNIRTVAGLRREADVIREYTQEIHRVEGLIHQKLRWRGVLNSTMQASAFFAYAVALCYGGVLVSEGQLPFQDIIKVSETLLYGSMMLAQSLAFTPAFSAALVAGHRLFQILDRRPKIVSPMGTIRNTLAKQLNLFEGVRYRGIEFRYPRRPDAKILQGLDLEVLKGQTVALVGHSGCGKSTCVQLLQRYYDPDEGSIHIDHDDIQHDLTLEGVRSRLGIVSQEPTLFERSIAENIAYGDNRRSVSMAEVMAAAKSANAHSFIISLPNGYDTRMGARGTQLSGGQKQRIAIARALVRNPKILLLDEATSALDLQSEQLVQQALDSACSGRTCIVIAHRLSTVQNADCICVVQNGRVVEQGTHLELISMRGIYAKLHKTQKDH